MWRPKGIEGSKDTHGDNGALDLITVNTIMIVPLQLAVFCARAFREQRIAPAGEGAGPIIARVPRASALRPRGRNSIPQYPSPPREGGTSSHGQDNMIPRRTPAPTRGGSKMAGVFEQG